jgi:site-specific recombinase XerD
VVERIAEFSRFLVRQDRSPATIKTYQWALRDFTDFLSSRRVDGLHQLTRGLLEAWQDRLIAARMRPRSRSLATTAVRQFLKWAGDHEYCDARLAGWLASVRVKPLKPKPIPPPDLALLLEHYGPVPARDGAYGLGALRNRAMFFYFLTTGARVSEALQVPRLGFQRATVRQKGGSEKTMTVPPSVQGIVLEYLQARVDRALLLFVTHPGERPLHAGAVRDVWQGVARELGIAPFTTHALRHTFATQLLARGVDIRIVADLMGHKNMQSIMGYTEVMESSRQLAMRAIEDVIQAPPAVPADPRRADPDYLRKPKQRGRPRFRIQK